MDETNTNQMAFWEAMKEKYERRNETLKQQEDCLRKRLEELKKIMEKQKAGEDCDCIPEKLEKPSLVQCLVEKGKNLILGTCKCDDLKVGEEFLCACHTEDLKLPLNVEPNLCPMKEPVPPQGCLNTTCDFYDPTIDPLDKTPSIFSLRTADIYYMDKIAELVKSEEIIRERIDNLANREHFYLNALQDIHKVINEQKRTEPVKKDSTILTVNLEEDNKKLRNDLKDLRLELKHCFERIEGPLKRSLENQRNINSQLEDQLKDLLAKTKSKEESHLKEIHEVKAKLCEACCTMVELSSTNSKLKNDLTVLQNNCANLEKELLNQKLQEAENILKIKNAFNRTAPEKRKQEKIDDTEPNLRFYAEKLGESLKEVCPCVTDVPSGLTETAENIRQLTELVQEKKEKKAQHRRRKKEEKDPQTTHTTSESEANDIIIAPESYPKSDENEIRKPDSCSCSNSSLRIRPRMDKNSFKTSQKTPSSNSLIAKPTMEMKASKQTSVSERKVPAKKTLSKGCTCCPAQNDCDNLQSKIQNESSKTLDQYSDLGSTKKTGPSEEVIAVKNLGTFSMPPDDQAMQVENEAPTKSQDEWKPKPRRNKLAVDTTCDILDKPPEDIHVVTTIANTGSLEITTEGPPGVIETKINYLPEGKIEIITKLLNHQNLESLLEGIVLHNYEEGPTCNNRITYGRQHDATTFKEESDHNIDCNPSETCEGLCDNDTEPVESNEPNTITKVEAIDEDGSPYGQVVVNNNFKVIGSKQETPFMTREWKNNEFSDNPENDAELHYINFLIKPNRRRQRKFTVHTDITSKEERFRLSARQSSMDVERVSEEENILYAANSAFPDILDTIREEDEDQYNYYEISTKRERINERYLGSFGQTMNPIKISTVVDLTVKSTLDLDYIKNKFILYASLKTLVIPKDEAFKIHSAKQVTCLNALKPTSQLQQKNLQLTFLEEESLNLVKTQQLCQDSLLRSRRYSTLDCRMQESFFELSQDISFSSGKITLKQSKSMNESRGIRSEYSRISKSASSSLESLEVLCPKTITNVGDSSESRSGNRGKPSGGNIEFVQLPLVSCKRSQFLKDGQGSLEVLTKGYDSLDLYRSSSEPIYQCYICHCFNENDENNDQQGTQNIPQLQNTQSLENRIDCLLNINPETISTDKSGKIQEDNENYSVFEQSDIVQHDENCTCVDCICNPCHFKNNSTPCDCEKCECFPSCAQNIRPTSLVPFLWMKPKQPTIVMNVSIPCDCNDKCFCSPCMDESRKSQPVTGRLPQPKTQTPSELQQQSGRSKNEGPITPNEERSRTPVESQLPSTWKNVVGCPCSPSSVDKKEVCECRPCECKPCSYQNKARTPCDCKPPNKEGKTNGSSGKCNSNPCPCKCLDFSSIGGDKKDENKCQCQLCECLFCSDSTARKQNFANDSKVSKRDEDEKQQGAFTGMPSTPQPATSICDCEKCLCHLCPDKSKNHPEISHGKNSGQDKFKETDKVASCNCSLSHCVNCETKKDEMNKGDNSTPIIQSQKHEKQKCACTYNCDTNEPLECHDCFICCDEDTKEKPINDQLNQFVANDKEKNVCECHVSCSCEPCPDPNVKKNFEPQMIGDTNRSMEELKLILDKIDCSCDQAEQNLKPLVKQASNFENTVSRMKMKLNNLQQKCKDKDQIIDAMSNELRMRSQSGVFENLLHELAHPNQKFIPDFTRTYVCDFLPKPRYEVGKPRYEEQKQSPLYQFDNTLEPICEGDRCPPKTYTKNLDASGMEIIDIRRVTIDSILIKWRRPTCINCVTGYQIFVNDELKYRVLSPNRTTAVIDTLDLSSCLEIMLFAISCFGRCEPPALATYRICN